MAKEKEILTASQVIERARMRLDDARDSLRDLRTEGRPELRLRAFRRLVRDSREVTFTLQRMSGVDGVGKNVWSDWYSPFQEEMKADPLLRAFHELRNYFEKQGGTSPGPMSVTIGNLNMRELRYYFLQPHGASNFFIGDHLGRSGWEIRLPNGRNEYRYVDLPTRWGVQVSFELRDKPESHLGTDVRGKPLDALAELVISYLDRLLDDAEDAFCPPR